MTRREAQRRARREERQRKLALKLSRDLSEMLARFLRLHYGDPTTGRTGAILDGPVIAKLSAAAALYSLLQVDDNAEENKSAK